MYRKFIFYFPSIFTYVENMTETPANIRVADRIRTQMELRGWSPADLARAVGLNYITVKKMLDERRGIKAANLPLYAKALDLTPEYLLTGVEAPPAGAQASNPVPIDDSFEKAPVYRLSQISAGRGAPAFGDAPQGYKHVPHEVAQVAKGTLAFVKVAGHSMTPTLLDGDYLVVETMTEMTPDVEVYVLRVDGEILVKRLARIGDQLSIQSDNKDYPTRIVGPNDDTTVEIVAAVRALQRNGL